MIPDERSERKTEVQIFLPAPCIRIQMHMQPPVTQVIVTAYTPVDAYHTRMHFIHARNFYTEAKHDADAQRRVLLVFGEDAAVLNHLQPACVPPLLSDELLIRADQHGTLFRRHVQAAEARGQAIDHQAMQREDDCARVIPSPRRREDPKNWVLRPVLMQAGGQATGRLPHGAVPGSMEVRPLTGALGCEIFGVDLANLSSAEFAGIHQAFLDYSAVMFHDQILTQEQFADFGKRFAKLEDEAFLPHRGDVPGVFYLRGAPKNAKTLSTQNLGWHADHTYQRNPSMGAMLYAREVPAAGGDTLFASNYLSYENLSPAMQVFLEDKIAIHDVLQYGLNSGHHSTATVAAIEMLRGMRENFHRSSTR